MCNIVEKDLNTLEELKIRFFNLRKSESYLDVGTGDGHRAIRIAKRLTATKVVLLDNETC